MDLEVEFLFKHGRMQVKILSEDLTPEEALEIKYKIYKSRNKSYANLMKYLNKVWGIDEEDSRQSNRI